MRACNPPCPSALSHYAHQGPYWPSAWCKWTPRPEPGVTRCKKAQQGAKRRRDVTDEVMAVLLRRDGCAAALDPTTMVLPVFPLGSTAYMPHSDHVLNIFEPRYRKMYNDILFNGARRF